MPDEQLDDLDLRSLLPLLKLPRQDAELDEETACQLVACTRCHRPVTAR